nr:MAG TPA: hypothetical protein [Caudoviricetes sp.]DAR85540.1 MAG TPA: hypothetical protein [Caudoviricetes sp.]DAY09995.1 MAG TPA: hypothetical protein [Caudoviricetes sp.]
MRLTYYVRLTKLIHFVHFYEIHSVSLQNNILASM